MDMLKPIASVAVGAAVGATAMYAATHDQRQVRRAVRKMTRGAEKALLDMEQMVNKYTR